MVAPEVDDTVLNDWGKRVSISARYMLQWFCPRRPGQFRGVCELAPAVPLYAQLRRYGLATLSAAEIAALFAGILTTKVPPGEEAPKIEPGFRIELERGTLMAVPEGSDVHQLKAEHPITNYEMFVNIILREIGRTIDVPFGIVAGDSSKYNYSSAQLDYRGYEERLNFDKKQLIIRIMNPVNKEFVWEVANRTSSDAHKEGLRKRLKKLIEANKFYHTWHFSRRPSSDPVKDATAEDMRLKNGTTNYAEIYAARGMDYEEQWDQREKENEIISKKKLVFSGISDTINVVDVTTTKPVVDGVSDSSDPTNTQTVDKQSAPTSDVQQTALNGAQIASLEAIAEKVANGVYSIKAGVLMLRVAFPSANIDLLTQLITELSKSEGTVTSPAVKGNEQSSETETLAAA
jgi:capsid protein